MSEYNKKRIESRIMEAVSMMIVTREIKHPRLSPFVSVSSVSVSKDNSYATIWITSFVEDKKLSDSVDALQSASGFIHQLLAVQLKTRNTPKLTFKADTSIREGEAMIELIDSLH